LLNASVGVQRAIALLRPGTGRRSAAAVTFQRRSISMAHNVRAGSRTSFRPSSERLVSITAVGLVGLAVALSNLGASPGGPTGNTSGAGQDPRLALGGAVAGLQGMSDRQVADGTLGEAQVEPEGNVALGGDAADVSGLGPAGYATIEGPFTADGTLVKPGSVDTSVDDGSDLLKTYRVRSGDSLSGIASKFHVSMMTLWWANDLKNKDDLKIGQTITIPPVSGVVVTVGTTDTLEGLSAKYHVDAEEIIDINGLSDPNLVVGQTLTIPGARSKPIATPKPTPAPSQRSTSSGGSRSSGGSVRPPSQYSGGKLSWPVAGGYISQYFHYGHYAIDIAADQGTRVMAAAGGTVTFAGWKNNGGGYQVWIAHGSGLFTTYNHMSAITVGRGQHVSRGQQVGRVGMTGHATGPHLHFEVWRGPIWDGGTRVNPLLYL